MTTLRLAISVFLLTILYSCTTNHRLTKKDLEFNPYKVGNILVFQSDKGESDTLVINSTDRKVLNEKCYSILTCIYSNLTTSSWEGFYVNTVKPSETWTGKDILTIRAEPNGTKTVHFDLYVKNAWWYGDSNYDLSLVNSLQTTSFKTVNQTYTDVIIFVSNNTEYIDRQDFIAKIYWSKTYGFVGFDKLNGDEWTVTKK